MSHVAVNTLHPPQPPHHPHPLLPVCLPACDQAIDEARGLGVFVFQRLVSAMLTEQEVSGALRVRDVAQPRLCARCGRPPPLSGRLSRARWPLCWRLGFKEQWKQRLC